MCIDDVRDTINFTTVVYLYLKSWIFLAHAIGFHLSLTSTPLSTNICLIPLGILFVSTICVLPFNFCVNKNTRLRDGAILVFSNVYSLLHFTDLAVVCCGKRLNFCITMQSVFEDLPRHWVCCSTLDLHCWHDLYVSK